VAGDNYVGHTGGMTGTLALIGGGEFAQTEALDRRLLDAAGTERVVVLPTADAFENPQAAVDRAATWFASLGASSTGLNVLTRRDALDPANSAALRSARFVYLVGDSPMHLRSTLKGTPVWDALLGVLDAGGVVAASTSAAAALCDPMVDSRGGAFTLGLGLVTGLALVTEAETWSAERLKRTLAMAKGFTVATMPSGSALIRRADTWEIDGPVELTGGGLPG
jgi:cyanophycinase